MVANRERYFKFNAVYFNIFTRYTALNSMTIGEKIRRIRKFRHMKQRELAVAIGLDEKSVSRIGQYEIGYRIAQKETLKQIHRF